MLVLALAALALAWPLVYTSSVSLVGADRLSINDLKRLRRGDPVELDGTVTFVDPVAKAFYFQDAVAGMRIASDGPLPRAGDVIKLRARLAQEYDAAIGLRSIGFADLAVTRRRSGPLPQAQILTIAELLRGNQQVEGRRIETSGVVRHVHLEGERLSLELGDGGKRMSATVLDAGGIDVGSLIDTRVIVRGALQLELDHIAETFAPHLWVGSPSDLVRVAGAPTAAASVTAHELHTSERWLAEGHRVSVEGRIVAIEPDDTLLLASGGLLLPVQSAFPQSVAVGDMVRATGWPTRQRWNVVLERATVVRTPTMSQPTAIAPQIQAIEVIRGLDHEEAAQGLPVRVRGVLTSVHYVNRFLFLQAGDAGIWVDAWGQRLDDFAPGQLVEITGVTAPGEFAPVIAQPWFKALPGGRLPTPQKVDPESAPSGVYDSKWVELEGWVRPFAYRNGQIEFGLETELGTVSALLVMPADPAELERFVDARVRARGALATSFTARGVLTGYRIFVHSLDDLHMIEPAPDRGQLETPRAIDELLKFRADVDASRRRVLVSGIVTLRAPGRLFVEDPTGSVQVEASSAEVFVGDVVEAIGYPTPSTEGPVLADAMVRPLGRREELVPQAVTPEEVMAGRFDNRLVSIEGRLVSQGQSAAQQTLVLRSGDTVFNAELEGSVPLGQLREGSVVRVVGICSVQRRPLFDRFTGGFDPVPESFRIMLRSVDDVTVLHAAPWWKWRHAWPTIALLTLSIVAAMLWARTLRRQVETQAAQIEQQRSFLRQVIDLCPDFISVRDRAGRYVLVNRAFARALGREPHELLGKTHEALGRPAEEAQAIAESDREVLEQCREKTIPEQSRITHGGETMWLRSVKRPLLEEDGRATHVLEVSNDITAHKQAEAVLEQARAAADAANRAKSEFLANISHEIRTPLNGIIGMTELCLDTDLTSEQREYVQALKASGDSLLRIINDILDFSKIEAGKLELESYPFDIRDILESVVRTFAARAHRQEMELVLDIAPEVPSMLVGDGNRVRQIFANLLEEALRAFAPSREALISASLLEGDAHCATLRFTVISSGALSYHEGRRVICAVAEDSAEQSSGSGIELALTISSRLIGMMNGRLWTEQTEGSEALHFTLCLPVAIEQAKRQADSGASLRDVDVLVVEDSEALRRVLGGWLAQAGARPALAATTSEALERIGDCHARGNPCAIALVDQDLPNADWTTFARSLRERDVDIPIVAMVRASTQRDGSASTRGLDVDAYLVKPVFAGDLYATLGRVLERQRSRQDARHHHEPRAAQGLRVLVAEDNPVNQMVMKRLLHKRGHEVVIADSGRAALAAFEAERFDLILMDVQMPELDGLEATREIRRRETVRGGRIPIIALTAHALNGDRERCLAAGMDSYMTKPVNPTELDEQLQKYAPRAGAS